jgi:hypothetical protein
MVQSVQGLGLALLLQLEPAGRLVHQIHRLRARVGTTTEMK